MTPGPWHTQPPLPKMAVPIEVKGWDGKLIAEVHTHADDAQLIAAAPMLAGTLKMCLENNLVGEHGGIVRMVLKEAGILKEQP